MGTIVNENAEILALSVFSFRLSLLHGFFLALEYFLASYAFFLPLAAFARFSCARKVVIWVIKSYGMGLSSGN